MDHPPCSLFASDLDGTLLGTPESGPMFTHNWEQIPEDQRPLLVFSTGRLLDDAREVCAHSGLLAPDYFICGVGTAIFDQSAGTLVKAFNEVLEEGWDADKVAEVLGHFPVTLQPRYYQTRFKASYYWQDADEEDLHRLKESLSEAGLDVDVVYSSARDLDILPRCANKGNALKWLVKHLNIPLQAVIAAGDSGNDSAMLNLPDVRGIVVENAQPELMERTVHKNLKGAVYQATQPVSEGVLQGLRHFGLIQEIDRLPRGSDHDPSLEPGIQHLLSEESHPENMTPEDLDFLRTAHAKALEGLRKCITPLGFSACSIEDNHARGTDSNYHSVWARDGSITVLGSLQCRGGEFREVQRQTLTTLLNYVNVNGQVPANVSVETGDPDYSGVGGICSIDSPMWLIVAVHDYVRHYKDLKLLRDYREPLQKAMNWLSAHDSNDDGLIEVPEAGDWTDLFGRSYNVLYDEVLWYRANISYGRLMELAGDEKLAQGYLRAAGRVKAAILNKFWPTTTPSEKNAVSFADMQFSLGDTDYLLAQVTPFSFDWRCDVFGNVMAFLFNVLDTERAQIAFRFMWGVGVNQPFPVSNLYPVVDAGDPMWKDYYTVNLLNLPHHYHNGGVWPFVGGFWVRFIHRLGLADLARQELLRLAQVNSRGIICDWEFNEWTHGRTGIPMGKRFQAWSCSEFLNAYHTLFGKNGC